MFVRCSNGLTLVNLDMISDISVVEKNGTYEVNASGTYIGYTFSTYNNKNDALGAIDGICKYLENGHKYYDMPPVSLKQEEDSTNQDRVD